MAKKRILIVEDSMELGRLLVMTFSGLDPDLSVTHMRSAEEAILETGKHAFDLVISDVRLPGMTGFEMARKLRKRYPDLPLIMMSGMQDERNRKQAQELGAEAFLAKPLDMPLLVELVQKVLGMGEAQAASPQADEQPLAAAEMEQAVVPPTVAEPLPTVSQNKALPPQLTQMMEQLQIEAGALAVALLDAQGVNIASAGEFPMLNFEQNWSSSVLAAVAASGQISDLMGVSQQGLIALQGVAYDLLILPIAQFVLVLILPSGRSILRLAVAVEEARLVRQELVLLLGGVAEPKDEAGLLDALATFGKNGSAQTSAPQTPPEDPAAAEALAALLAAGTAPVKDADPDSFWEDAVQSKKGMVTNADVLTYEQAMQLGLAPAADDEQS
jgi:CheY-like chemotaxis protein